MKYAKSDLYTIMQSDCDSHTLLECLREFRAHETRHFGGGILNLSGSTTLDGDTYLVYMSIGLEDDKPVYNLTIDQVTVVMPIKQYIYLSTYLDLLSSINLNKDEENKVTNDKSWWRKLFK